LPPDRAEARFVTNHGAGGAALLNVEYLHIDCQPGQPAVSVADRTPAGGNLANHPASPMSDLSTSRPDGAILFLSALS
jgi:hypothetical protein